MAISTRVRGDNADTSLDDTLDELLRRFGADARAKAVFGDPVEHDGIQVIPVARVGWGFGAGRRGDKRRSSKGLGAGLGVSPVGYIEITDGATHFRPIRPWWVEWTYVVGAATLAVLLLRHRTNR